MAFNSSDINKLNRNFRNLGHHKSSRTTLGEGTPSDGIGNDGDFRLHTTDTGVKLYAKYANKWYGFSADESSDNAIFSTGDDGGLADNGSVMLPGGFIMQWGNYITDATTETVTFPMEFPTKCAAVYLTGFLDSPPTGGGYDHGVVSFTNTGFVASTVTGWEKLYFLAIGN